MLILPMLLYHHFRTPKGIEVDVVVEFDEGEVVGVEVTQGQTVTGDDFRGNGGAG